MSKYIAFLHALNTGKNRTVSMASIRLVFEELGFSDVATVLVSGNVIFRADDQDTRSLELKIEEGLQNAFKFGMTTFIRTDTELTAVAAYRPYLQAEIEAAAEYNIIFLADEPDEDTRQRLMALNNAENEFRIHGREIYWLRHKQPGRSTFSTVPLAKAIRSPFTIRTANTVTRIAQKWGKFS